MQRNTANTVEGCSYSLLCVAIGRPSRYSSAWAEDEADIVGDVEESLSVYRRIIIFVEEGSTDLLKETRASRAGSAQVQVARRQRKYMTRHASGKLTPQIPLHPCLASEVECRAEPTTSLFAHQIARSNMPALKFVRSVSSLVYNR
jgi:hypothetical protein